MSERERWQARHLSNPTRPAPSPFVVRHVTQLATQRRGAHALDVASGSGRHAELLAAHGFRTVSVDHAAAACQRVARELTGVEAVVGDARKLPFQIAAFAVIVQTLFLEREIFPRLLALLAPGGVLLAETFLVAQHEATGHPRRDFCLAPGELVQLCTGAGVAVRVLETREGIVQTAGGATHLAAIAVCKV